MMKKILLTIGLFTALCLSILMTGCDSRQAGSLKDYTVTCKLDEKLMRDSATLLVLEPEYHKLRVCATAHPEQGVFSFKGQIDAPRVALIRWDNDSTRPFYFVLEAGHIQLSISPGSWSVSGSPQNVEYMKYIKQRNNIMNARVATWQEYLKAASGSSLKREDELRLVKQDSLLNDSLQRFTVQRINRGDAVGRIIRERFTGQLDKGHARLLK